MGIRMGSREVGTERRGNRYGDKNGESGSGNGVKGGNRYGNTNGESGSCNGEKGVPYST